MQTSRLDTAGGSPNAAYGLLPFRGSPTALPGEKFGRSPHLHLMQRVPQAEGEDRPWPADARRVRQLDQRGHVWPDQCLGHGHPHRAASGEAHH